MESLNRDWYGLLRGRAGSRRGRTAFWLNLAALVVALNLYAPASPTLIERLLASTIALLAFGAIWRWTYRGDGQAEFGFLPVMLTEYFLLFSLSIFTQKFYPLNFDYGNYLLNSAAIDKALVMCLIGLALILFGYYWVGHAAATSRILPRFQMRWRDKTAVQFVSVAFMVLGLAAYVISFVMKWDRSVQAFVTVPGDFFFLAMVTLFLLQLEGELNFILKVLLWALFIPARIFFGIAQGELGFGIQVVMALVVAFATMRRRMPWLVFVCGFAAIMTLQPVKARFRQFVRVGNEENKEQPQGEKFAALLNSAQLGVSVLETFDFQEVVAIATSRLNDISVFASLVERTPSQVPYWGGSTFYKLAFVPIPRILYREKPDYSVGIEFAHKYLMTTVEDYTVSINLPQIAEFYGNFGPIGVLIGSILLGAVYRLVIGCFVHPGSGLGAIAVAIYFCTQLLDIENAIAETFGGLWTASFVALIFCMGVRAAEEVFAAARSRDKARGFGTVSSMGSWDSRQPD